MVELYSKELFLSSINGGLDFYSFLIPHLEKTDDNNCKRVLNPFYDDTKPSLSIYFDEVKNRWLFYDHGTSSDGIQYKGDVFDFAGYHYKLSPRTDFKLLIEKMATDLNVKMEIEYVDPKLSDPYSWFQMEYWRDPEDYWAWAFGFELFYRGDKNGVRKAYDYYKQFGITEAVLKEYRVAAIDWYKQADKALDIKKIRISKDQLLIAYQELDFVKFYSPDPKKFWFAGTKQKDYVFGWKQIISRTDKAEKRRSTLLITGGEKDVLTLTSLGYDAVCFNSETASVPKEAVENLISRYEKIVILYDLDQTGVTQATNVAAKLNDFNVSICTLPDSLKDVGGKDVSDYIRLGMPVIDLQKLIEEAVMVPFERDSKSAATNSDYVDEDNKQEGIDSVTPLIPEEVYSLLPQTLQQLCSAFEDKRDRDVALLSSIGVLSSCFPHVRGIYGGKDVGCNINLFISAPASAGKGIMSWSRLLGKSIANHLKEKYKQEFRQYQYDFAEYNKNRDNPDLKCPVVPIEQRMFIPANSAGSSIIEFLDANQKFGIIFDTEGDTLSSTLKNDWAADFSSILRKAFHHEPVSIARRGGKEFREVDNPHLSVILSGTRNQVGNLIGSVENGLFSRLAFYDFDSTVEWKDQFGSGDNKMEKLFNQHGRLILQYWKKGEIDGDSIFLISDEQRDMINEYFSQRLKALYSIHGEDIIGSVKRICLIYYRIAILLSAIGQYNGMILKISKMPAKIEVDERYARAAFLIVENMLTHLEMVYSRMKNTVNLSKLNLKQKELYLALPKEEFNWPTFISVAKGLDINKSTTEKYRRDFLKCGLIISPMPNSYLKV